MRIHWHYGLLVIFRHATDTAPAIGFKIKSARHMMFSERYGYARGFRLGPIYFGTFWRPMNTA